MPDVIVVADELRDAFSSDGLQSVYERGRLDPTVGKIFLDDVDIDAFADELRDVVRDLRRLGLRHGPERKSRRILALDAVVDSVSAQKDVELRARAPSSRG